MDPNSQNFSHQLNHFLEEKYSICPDFVSLQCNLGQKEQRVCMLLVSCYTFNLTAKFFLLHEEMSALSCNILPCCKKPYWIKYIKSFFLFLFLFYVNLFCVSSKKTIVTVTASSYAGLSLLGKVSDVFHCQWSLQRNIFISCRHNSETAVYVGVSLN